MSARDRPFVMTPSRILVFQTAYLGDVVLTTPLVAALRRAYPDAAIDMVVQPAWTEVVRHHEALNDVLAYDKRGAHRGPRGLLTFARVLRERNYDVALCPHPSLRSALTLFAARIPVRVGFSDSAGAFLFTHRVRRDKSAHEVRRVMSLVAALGQGLEPIPPARVALDPGIDGDALLSRLGLVPGRPFAAVHPGSVWATKRWTAQGFGAVGRDLAHEFERIVVLGGPGEESVAREVAEGIGGAAIDLSGRVKLNELCALLARAALLVTNDSGPMHIAASHGVPVVAIFGSTVPALGYAPWGTRSRVVEIDLDCRPCGPHGHRACPRGHFRCMKDISPDMVTAACTDLLRG
ncbi:MAG: lipopolysaccharide heptosyltransferase II [Deltaproteobacteria bacterium]|nr:lipopolysaccharide heptosyltransferase II [Deltaproteobacteria bacterium]